MKVAWNYCRKFQLKRCQKRRRNISNVLLRRFAPPPYRKTKYCGDHLCLFVGLCVRVLCEHISETTHPVITKYRYFCCDVTHGCCSALLWRRCNTFYVLLFLWMTLCLPRMGEWNKRTQKWLNRGSTDFTVRHIPGTQIDPSDLIIGSWAETDIHNCLLLVIIHSRDGNV